MMLLLTVFCSDHNPEKPKISAMPRLQLGRLTALEEPNNPYTPTVRRSSGTNEDLKKWEKIKSPEDTESELSSTTSSNG